MIGQGRLGLGIGLLALLIGNAVGGAGPVHAVGAATISCTGWSYCACR